MLRGEKIPHGYYRIVIHACIFNDNNEMLIQQRQPFKKGWSNMWDISVGGSAITGETSQVAAEREISEELGIDISLYNKRASLTINFDGGFDDIYLIEKNIDISDLKLQYEEVQNAKWASQTEIIKMIDDGTFIPYHKSLIELLFYMKNHNGTHTRNDSTSANKD